MHPTSLTENHFKLAHNVDQSLQHILALPEVRIAPLHQPNEEQKVNRYNATKLLQLNLDSNFTGHYRTVLDDYSTKWKKEDLQNRWLSAAEAIMIGVSDEWVYRKSLKMATAELDDETIHDLENQVGAYGALKRSDFKNDFAYTKAIIRHVRRAHSIDDRLENARKESISNNFLTQTKHPFAL